MLVHVQTVDDGDGFGEASGDGDGEGEASGDGEACVTIAVHVESSRGPQWQRESESHTFGSVMGLVDDSQMATSDELSAKHWQPVGDGEGEASGDGEASGEGNGSV